MQSGAIETTAGVWQVQQEEEQERNVERRRRRKWKKRSRCKGRQMIVGSLHWRTGVYVQCMCQRKEG